MRKLVMVILLALLISGCSSTPEIIDNGQPGQIKVITYLDENNNRVNDAGEPALSDRVSIGQDVSCPIGNNQFKVAETDSTGVTVYQDLPPGRYCVMYMGSRGSTTNLTVEVYLSSEQEAVVSFGLTER